MNKPRLIILAGPNGAGKSTFSENKDLSFISELGIESFDYDLILKQLYDRYLTVMTPYIENNISIKTKELFEEEAEKAILNKTHFSFQTNYDKEYTDKWRTKFHNAGFQTELYFLYVDSVELCEQRVAKRVEEGGHNVPLEEIIKRYKNGLVNRDLHFDKFDKVVLIDTSKNQNILLLETNELKINYLNEGLAIILFKNNLSNILNWLNSSLGI